MTLIRTSLLNGIAVGVHLLSALALNKILAIFVGPAGYALIGQFQNVISIATTIASGATNTGVTKYTAEYQDKPDRQLAVWRTAGVIAICGSLASAAVIAISYRALADTVFASEGYSSLFLWFSATLIMFVVNALLLAILNGKKDVHRFVASNILGSLISAALTALFSVQWGLYGALLALAINQSVVLVATLFLCLRTDWFKLSILWGRPDPAILKKLAKYALMAITTACTVPLSHMLIRNYLAGEFGLQAAGYWQAVWKISEMYLMLITTSLAVYYLPRLSEIKQPNELKLEILKGYRLLLPIAVFGAVTIFLLREWIVSALFSPEFGPMTDLFGWQLSGDVLKIGSWLIAYVMLGRALTKTYIVSEVAFNAIFVALVIAFTRQIGLTGVTLAYCTTYFLYWISMFLLIWRRIDSEPATTL